MRSLVELFIPARHARGEQLLCCLQRLTEHPHIGNVGGRGFICGFDILKDPENDEALPVSDGMGAKLLKTCQRRGLISRVRNDGYLLAPPLLATEEQVDEILTIVGNAAREVTARVGRDRGRTRVSPFRESLRIPQLCWDVPCCAKVRNEQSMTGAHDRGTLLSSGHRGRDGGAVSHPWTGGG